MSLSSYLTKANVCINANRTQTGIEVTVSADHPYGRKSALHVNAENLKNDLKNEWYHLKKCTSKIKKVRISFSQIDHYDNLTNIYDVPSAKVERGISVPRIGYQEYGDIPKDWQTNIELSFDKMQQSMPVLKCIKQVCKSIIHNELHYKKIQKMLQSVISGKTESDMIEIDAYA